MTANDTDHLISEDIYKYLLDTMNSQITDFARQLTLKKDSFEVSFLPKGCVPVLNPNGTWKKQNRQSGKPGKIIQKVIGAGKFKNADYEKFVYRLKALWTDRGYTLKVVSGEDIRYWYNYENYYERSSTLGNSCMSHPTCAHFFDLYCEQPECKMLVALKEEKLAARALVWTVGDKTFLDRIYYIEDCLYNILTNYAKEQKWYIRECNELLSDGEDQYFLGPKDDYKESEKILFEIKLKRFYDYWPYIDSFRYLDVDSKTLRTYKDGFAACCSFTNGSYQDRDEEEYFYCSNCDSEIDEDDLTYSEFFREDGCVNCMHYSETMDDYIPERLAITLINRRGRRSWICSEWIEREAPNDYVLIGNSYYEKEDPNIKQDENGQYYYEDRPAEAVP